MISKVIDVSYYQKDIDYDAVEAAGVQGRCPYRRRERTMQETARKIVRDYFNSHVDVDKKWENYCIKD